MAREREHINPEAQLCQAVIQINLALAKRDKTPRTERQSLDASLESATLQARLSVFDMQSALQREIPAIVRGELTIFRAFHMTEK